MRLGYVGSATAHEQSRAWWKKNGQDPDRALHLVRTWAWSPWLQEYQQRLGHALHERTPLPNTWKEVAIVRVCARVHSAYELFHHVPLARSTGLANEIVEAALDPRSPAGAHLAPEWRDLLAVVDALDDGRPLTVDLWHVARRLMSIDQLVALNAVVGYWRTNARLATMCELETESWMHPEASTAVSSAGAPRPIFVPSALDAGSAVPVPAESALTERAREWLGRSSPTMRPLARWWSWVEDLQVANQRWWSCLEGEYLELDTSMRGWVSQRACAAVGAAALGAVVSQAFPVDPAGVEPEVDEFITRWDQARALDDGVAERLVSSFGRRRLVELQLVYGFVVAQARLSNLMDGPA